MDDIRNAFVVLDTLLLVISRYDIKRTIFSEFIISNKDNLMKMMQGLSDKLPPGFMR